MVNRNLLRELDVEDELKHLIPQSPDQLLVDCDFQAGQVYPGQVTKIEADLAFIDIGYKSDGMVPLAEWPDAPPKLGESVDVLLEDLESAAGQPNFSKRKADSAKAWQTFLREYSEGDVATGTVVRQIKGGLLVDLGVNVFLPSSQIDIRRPANLARYVGQSVQALVLKIDPSRPNAVISRRALLEQQRSRQKRQLLSDLKVGQRRRGVVVNVAAYGAFVDLGGLDGLLHRSDMRWHRVGHAGEVVQPDEDLEVQVLSIDLEDEKVSLGLKQLLPNPWNDLETKYAVNSVHRGEVTQVVSYGAFVQLEPGVEGLVHISQMSWNRRKSDPGEFVKIGDPIDVMVLSIDKAKQEVSLGMKQLQQDPWEDFAAQHPPGTRIQGVVRGFTGYGAFVEVAPGIDGLLHVSDMSWTKKLDHPSELLSAGQSLTCMVLSMDAPRRRVALGLRQLEADPWESTIGEKFPVGSLVRGRVTKLIKFGAFVELDPGLEGLLHISEMSDDDIANPAEVVHPGDEVEVRVLKVDSVERKIGLSLRPPQDSAHAPAPVLKGGIG